MSRRRPVLLLTGFQPFGRLRRNPSGDLVHLLARDGALARRGLVTSLLPVHRHRAPAKLARLLARHRPDLVLMVGVAAGRDACCHEVQGANAYRGPRSRSREPRPILRTGPARLRSTLPAEPVLAALRGAGLRARTSRSAGTFTCNLVLYLALRWATAPPRGHEAHSARVAFLHVPATPESLPLRPRKKVPTVQLSELSRGVRAVVRELLAKM